MVEKDISEQLAEEIDDFELAKTEVYYEIYLVNEQDEESLIGSYADLDFAKSRFNHFLDRSSLSEIEIDFEVKEDDVLFLRLDTVLIEGPEMSENNYETDYAQIK